MNSSVFYLFFKAEIVVTFTAFTVEQASQLHSFKSMVSRHEHLQAYKSNSVIFFLCNVISNHSTLVSSELPF